MNDIKEYIPASCGGEKCFCGKKAYRKVSEVVFDDDPLRGRHELTAYVCKKHFKMIM